MKPFQTINPYKGIADGQYNGLTAIATGSSPWYTYGYFNATTAINTTNLAYWVAAAMQGSLLGYAIANSQKVSEVNQDTLLVGALVGGIGIAAGKVLYKWVPKVPTINLNQLNLMKQNISNLILCNPDAKLRDIDWPTINDNCFGGGWTTFAKRCGWCGWHHEGTAKTGGYFY